jgi:hypothetical protein
MRRLAQGLRGPAAAGVLAARRCLALADGLEKRPGYAGQIVTWPIPTEGHLS